MENSPKFIIFAPQKGAFIGRPKDIWAVLATTYRDLNALVAEGRFREDLLYRPNVVPTEVPTLRKRVAYIRLLVEYFIDRFGRRAGKNQNDRQEIPKSVSVIRKAWQRREL